MRKRNALFGLAVAAAGVAAGAALEEVVYRRIARRSDPEANEPIGAIPGKSVWVDSFDGASLFARTYGPDEAEASIVFSHGVIEHQVIWHYLIRDLRADGRYKLVAYDHRGHGNSSAARGPEGTTLFDGETLARDMSAVIHATTKGPVLTVGHSLGGMAALAYLTADTPYRDRIHGAVLVNSTFTAQLAGWRGRGNAMQRTMERLNDIGRRFAGDDAKRIERLRPRSGDIGFFASRATFGRDPSPKHVATSFQMSQQCASQTMAAALDLHSYDVYDLLPEIAVPVLIVAGERDIVTPAFLSEEMAKRIPDNELVIFEGCGHQSPFERHQELVAHIRKFADKVFA